MHLIAIEKPVIGDHEARFSFTLTPASDLYTRTHFALRLPESVELGAVPEALWWRIGLICLHAHWPLLRPCRVLLPVRLPAGEVEFWLRLTDAAVATLETQVGRADTRRKIELADRGPLVPLGPPLPAGNGGEGQAGVVSCFSGGRDSIAQAAILKELGGRPTLVTVTSPVGWSNEHETPRRRAVLEQMVSRTGLELVEVSSDFRSSWENSFSWEYGISVNEVTDALLYLAAAIAVSAARGASLVLMASEAEVQESVRRGGAVIQANHYMYSAATHRALSALLAPAGLTLGSLTNSLRQFQVQRLLAERYGELRDLQYSCWELGPKETACSRCLECRGIALNLLAGGVTPAVAGIDPVKLLLAHSDWEPGGSYVLQSRMAGAPLPRESTGYAHEMQELRCLAATPPERVASLLGGDHPPGEREAALEVYVRLRERALNHPIEPEPGYRAGYLELLAEPLRGRLRTILDQHFEPARADSYAPLLANTRLLSDWVSAPLRSDRVAQPDWAAAQQRPAQPAAEPEPRPELIPDPEPKLERPSGGRQVRVADTLLDGNELAYVSKCVTDNWISSAGPFVRRLERGFADAVGCRFAIACSSGTTALHLALAAAGLGPGDEVIVPAFTMIATANAARYVGADPVLVDADPVTWNLDPERIADKLTRRTRAIVAVHTYGQPADMDALSAVAERNGLILIEDAAEAHGARYAGRSVGSLGQVAAFSFYGNKILTTGEGGIVTSNDERIAAVARELRDQAFSRERHFWHRRLGFNYRMSNLQAAVGVAQLERLQQLVERRRLNGERYRDALAEIDGLELPPEVEGGVNWMFGVRIGDGFGASRDELRRRLAARGVETRTFFVPLHLQPLYRPRFGGQRYPVAEQLGATGLYLPSGSGLTPEDIAYVADAVRAISGAMA